MIKLIYEAPEDLKEFGADKVVIEKEVWGSAQEYVLAFADFMRGCGFVEGTIAEVLPTSVD